jgi:hypothetical protein
MRQFKFRAWDKENKCWMNLGEIIIEWRDITGFMDSEDNYYELDRIDLMQYTDYSDKNDKLIYEDDIVEYKNGLFIVKFGWWEPGYGDHIQSVCGYYLSPIDGSYRQDFCIDDECEIVGNKHENPELLNATE